MIRARSVVRMEDRRSAYRISVGMSEGKRPLGRHSGGWKANINMDVQEVGWEDGLG
jgi:hypothetical protein